MKKSFYMVTLLASTTLFASIPSRIPPGQWQCLAFDARHHSFAGLGTDAASAMRAANALCRQQAGPKSACQTAESFCEQGPLSLNSNSCIVSDMNGRSFSANGDDACRTAMRQCSQWQYLHGKANPCVVVHR